MSEQVWAWHSPPGWPPPPLGWRPTPNWAPPTDWPPPPPGWQFWVPAPPPPVPSTPTALTAGTPDRRDLVWETRFVMLAFLLSGVMSAVILIVRHAFNDNGNPDPVPLVVPGHPLPSLLLGIPYYLVVAAMVPLVLLLLRRTGQGRRVLGLGLPGWRSDIWPAIGLIAAGWGSEIVLLVPLAAVIKGHPGLLNQTSVLHVPHYYVIYGLAISATTAVAEEVIVNGYLLVRLNQLGWTPRRALIPEPGPENQLSHLLRPGIHLHGPTRILLHPVVSKAWPADAGDPGPFPVRRHLDINRHLEVRRFSLSDGARALERGRNHRSYNRLSLRYDVWEER